MPLARPPTAPPGTNQWQFYVDTLDNTFYPDLGGGYETRCFVLLGLVVLMTLILTIRVVLKVVHGRRTGRMKDEFWFARRVRTAPETIWLITCQRNFGVWLCFVCVLVLIPYTVFYYRVYSRHANQYWSATWSGVVWLPIVLQGYLLAFANWHSHAVVMESQGKKWPSWLPIVSDIVYFSGLLLFIAFSVTVQVLASHQWQVVWTEYQALRTAMVDLIPTWTPALAKTNPLQAQFEIMFKAANRMETLDMIMSQIYGVMLIVTAIVNASILSVYLVIKKQLKLDFNVASHLEEEEPPHHARSYTTVLGTQRAASNFRTTSIGTRGVGVATQESQDEERKRRQKLKLAASTTVSSGVFVSFSWLLFGIVCFWTSSIPCLSFDGAVSPLKIEMSRLLIVWAYAIIITIVCIRVDIESYRYLPSADTGALKILPPVDTIDFWIYNKERRQNVVSGIRCGRETEVMVEMHQTGRIVQMEFDGHQTKEETASASGEESDGSGTVATGRECSMKEPDLSEVLPQPRRGSKVTFYGD